MAITITLHHDPETGDVIIELECPAGERGSPAASLAVTVCEQLYQHLEPHDWINPPLTEPDTPTRH